jgi:type IV secretory pathway TrbF-like protein
MMLKMSAELLNSHDQKLTLHYVVEIRKLITLEENKEPALKPEPEPKEITMTLSELIEGLRLIEHGIKVSEGTDWKEQREGT